MWRVFSRVLHLHVCFTRDTYVIHLHTHTHFSQGKWNVTQRVTYMVICRYIGLIWRIHRALIQTHIALTQYNASTQCNGVHYSTQTACVPYIADQIYCQYVLQCVAVCCSVLQCTAVYCSVLKYAALCCSVLQCVAVCCSVLQCVAVCCSVLQCAEVCCTMLQCTCPIYLASNLLSID